MTESRPFRSLPSDLPSYPFSSRSALQPRFLSSAEPVTPVQSFNSSAVGFGVGKRTGDPGIPPPQQHSGSTGHIHASSRSHEQQSAAPSGAESAATPTSSASPKPKPRSLWSSAKLENARYQPAGPSRPDHPNEDEVLLSPQGNVKLLAVFDGHDGSNAVRFATEYLEKTGKKSLLTKVKQNHDITEDDLVMLFRKMDTAFFNNIKRHTDRKLSLQAAIPVGLSSYEAYLRFPEEVMELQDLDRLVSGGTTAVVAVILNRKLHIANVGDSRALLVRQLADGHMIIEQLSTDHVVENEMELIRLSAIGLDPDQLRRSGRLGSQENTRSIGDYCLKQGYKDVDSICHAAEPPGIAIPAVCCVDIDPSFKYLILMSDGVYKTIESLPQPAKPVKGEQQFLSILQTAIECNARDFTKVAEHILSKISNAHEHTYHQYASSDPRSPEAVQCRKRDDMALVVYQFGSS